MSRFLDLDTTTVSLGACQCPGTPHEEDSAEVYTTLGWDDLVDVGEAPSEGAGRRLLVTRAVARWNLVHEVEVNGKPTIMPVPIVEATVRLLDSATLAALAEAVNAAYEAARAPVPNDSGAPLADSSQESAPRGRTKTQKPTTST